MQASPGAIGLGQNDNCYQAAQNGLERVITPHFKYKYINTRPRRPSHTTENELLYSSLIKIIL